LGWAGEFPLKGFAKEAHCEMVCATGVRAGDFGKLPTNESDSLLVLFPRKLFAADEVDAEDEGADLAAGEGSEIEGVEIVYRVVRIVF
jgi:hypothetical protein